MMWLAMFIIAITSSLPSKVLACVCAACHADTAFNVSNSIQSHCDIKPSVKMGSSYAMNSMKHCGWSFLFVSGVCRIADRHPVLADQGTR